jgi:hypothetical protein
MVSDDASYCKFKMILNLNDPSKIEDTSWIKPMKYVGIWWECMLEIDLILQVHKMLKTL